MAKEDDDGTGPAPALSGVEEATAATKTPAVDLAIEEENSELSGALDAYFGASEEAPEPATEQVAEVDILTEAIEASLEDEQEVNSGSFQVELSSLGAILPAAVRVLDREKLQQADVKLAILQAQSPSSEHKALAQLMQSVVTLLPRQPAKTEDNTEQPINYLYEQLMSEQQDPAVLVTAIGRFNSWLQEAGALMPLVPAAGDDDGNEPQFHYTAKELYFELAQLRLYMNDEFAKIRHHLKHHH